MMYRLLNFMLWPLWFFYTLRVALREKNLRYFKQRLGYCYPAYKNQPVWIHCASVGEVNTYLPLHHLLLEQYPDLQFVITTNTPTGAQILAKQTLRNTQHVFLPMDTFTAVHRFFSKINPRLALIMETELWPELYRQCSSRAVPIVIVNARLSHKTRDVNEWLKKMYSETLKQVDYVLCRSEEDASAFVKLGADVNKVKIVGNLKFSVPAVDGNTLPIAFTSRPYILAASTHEDEEWQLANMWLQLSVKSHLLVIAPRHPQRRDVILKKLQTLKKSISVRSQGDSVDDNTFIYLADTLGELISLMAGADIVIMGGSLVKRGGQNLLEPARLGKSIVVGPYMYNFSAETESFLRHDACVQVQDIESLRNVIVNLLSDKNARSELGKNAKNLVLSNQGVAQQYLSLISQIICAARKGDNHDA